MNRPKSNNISLMWVDMGFKKKFKREAVNADKSILALSREIGKDPDPLKDMFNKNEKKKFKFQI